MFTQPAARATSRRVAEPAPRSQAIDVKRENIHQNNWNRRWHRFRFVCLGGMRPANRDSPFQLKE